MWKKKASMATQADLSEPKVKKSKGWVKKVTCITALLTAVAGLITVITGLFRVFFKPDPTNEVNFSQNMSTSSGVQVGIVGKEVTSNTIHINNGTTINNESSVVIQKGISSQTLFAYGVGEYESGNYQAAELLFADEQLTEELAAIINRGYLYEHHADVFGMTEEEGIQQALSFYQQVDTPAALRGQLSCHVKLRTTENDTISTLVNKLIAARDEPTLNYLAQCAYEKNYEELSAEERAASIDLSCLFVWKNAGTVAYDDIVPDTLTVRYISPTIKWETNTSQEVDRPYVVWQKQQLPNIELLDCFQNTLT